MLFGQIISICGFNPKEYLPLANVPVEVFDEKGAKIKEDNLVFVETLFSRNSNSKNNFEKYLEDENSTSILPDTLLIRISEDVVAIYATRYTKLFFR